jgi:hypothetical protein
MRKSEDFPHPFGPTTKTWSPRFMENERALTSTLPPGVMIGLKSQRVSFDDSRNLHINELDIFALDHRSSFFHQIQFLSGLIIGDESLFKMTSFDVIHDI